jgi:hypothetical protein
MSTEKKVTILWSGGWDDYLVDTSITREMTAEEVANNQARIDKGWGGLPTVGGDFSSAEWLRCCFYDRSASPTIMVRVIRHLGGGD